MRISLARSSEYVHMRDEEKPQLLSFGGWNPHNKKTRDIFLPNRMLGNFVVNHLYEFPLKG